MISTNHEGEDVDDASPDCHMSSKSIRATENNLKDQPERKSLIKIDETTDEFGVIYQNSLEPVDDM